MPEKLASLFNRIAGREVTDGQRSIHDRGAVGRHRATGREAAGDARGEDSGSPGRPAPLRARYLTDGLNLYRIVGHVGRSVNDLLVELEDCRSLEILVVTVQELRRGRLRPVRVAAAA